MTFGEPLPVMLTTQEVADQLLRTSRKAVYELVRRRKIPGVVRVGRRLLFRRDTLLKWLGTQTEQSLGG